MRRFTWGVVVDTALLRCKKEVKFHLFFFGTHFAKCTALVTQKKIALWNETQS